MPVSYTSGQSSNFHGHSTCLASSQRIHTVSITPCHGAWTSGPLSAHLSTEKECTASQNETSICTRRTTTYHWSVHLRATTEAQRHWHIGAKLIFSFLFICSSALKLFLTITLLFQSYLTCLWYQFESDKKYHTVDIIAVNIGMLSEASVGVAKGA